MEAESKVGKTVAIVDQSGRRKIASLVIFDMETNTASSWQTKKITELCFLSVQTDEIKTKKMPRVVNKLLLCLNPVCVLPPEIGTITGLYNDHLEQMCTFHDAAHLIRGFLASQPRPVCIIAHYGNGFDFPILIAELQGAGHSLPEDPDILCADSLEAFRMLDGLPPEPEWVLKKEAEQQKRAGSCASASSSTNLQMSCANSASPGTQVHSSKPLMPTTTSAVSGMDCCVLTGVEPIDTDSSGSKPCSSQQTGNEIQAIKPLVQAATGTVNSTSACVHNGVTSNTSKKRSAAAADTGVATTGGIGLPVTDLHRVSPDSDESSTSAAAKVPRLGDLTAVPDISSQFGITDRQLVEAPEDVHSEVHILSKAELHPTGQTEAAQVDPNSPQASNEKTPPRGTESLTAANIATQFVKRGQSAHASNEERDKVSRRLFYSDISGQVPSLFDSNANGLQPTTITSTEYSVRSLQPSAQKPFSDPSASNTGTFDDISGFSSEGSIPHEEFLALVQEIESENGLASHGAEALHSSTGNDSKNNNAQAGEVSKSCSSGEEQTSCSSAFPSNSIPDNLHKTHPVEQAGNISGVNLTLMSVQTPVQFTGAVSECSGELKDDGTSVPAGNDSSNKTGGASKQTASPKVSYKLGEIHRRMFGSLPAVLHTAEDDCKTLLRIILNKAPEFLDWVNDHAVPLHFVQTRNKI